MADNQNQQPSFQFPTRSIIITGERVARMTTATVRVSRIDQRIVQMSMGTSPATRDTVRRASDDYNQAFAMFEASLKELEKVLDGTNKPNKERRREERRRDNQSDSSDKRPTLSRDPSSSGAKANSPTQPAGGQSNAKTGNGKPVSSGKARGEQQPKGQSDNGAASKAEAQKPAEASHAQPTPKTEPAPAAAPAPAPVPIPAAEPVDVSTSLNSL
ncbi:hypothetical protein [Pseudomonas sp. MWU12-2323]|uniref:hypothetical protein n=1 Tax=Pseudomonas sp. MWU12-2323 TaxID=2651296 RepID=UPI00128D3D17|nr:hypothetical protein [Pseudomonas sp. MWU12-2323]MPQ69423.1 hypothetical protein [Pseudomonas sp. MWU12-2323]